MEHRVKGTVRRKKIKLGNTSVVLVQDGDTLVCSVVASNFAEEHQFDLGQTVRIR